MAEIDTVTGKPSHDMRDFGACRPLRGMLPQFVR